MRSTGENLIMDDNYAVDSIRPKCIELQRMCDQYKQLVRQRREILQKSNDLQDRIDKVRYSHYSGYLEFVIVYLEIIFHLPILYRLNFNFEA